MNNIHGKMLVTLVIIVLLVAILLAVTNPDQDAHIRAMQEKLSQQDSVSNLINRGLLTVDPPGYTSYALFSMTEYDKSTASVGLLGYVWVNRDAFR